MPRRRRIEDALPPTPTGPTSIFGPGEDNIVPGEVIVTLAPDAMAELTTSLPRLPLRSGLVGPAVRAVGINAFDKLLGQIDAESVTQVHGPSPTHVVSGIMMASDMGLDGTMRIRYGESADPTEIAGSFADLGEVVWAEPSRWREATVIPNDPQFGSQWGLTRINAPAAWDLTTGDPSIVVAIVDTGIDLNHPELASLLVAGQDLVDFPPGSIPRPGWVFEGDFTGVDAVPQDEVGHGTHVAGTVSSLSNNAVGVAGVGWNLRLMPVKVLARIRRTSDGRVSGAGSSANIAAGIRWAADNGARVINMSLGGYVETTVEREAVAYAISRGVVVVAAMANDNVADPSFPAAFPDVIAVGATDSTDARASFSNFGPHITLVAPGVDIQSTYWDDTYASLDGTSMATPHVAGVAGLMLSRNPGLTPAQVMNHLRTTALPLRDNPTDPVPNDNYGSGLLQADAAVRAALPPTPSLQLRACPIRTFPITTCPQQSVITLCRSQQIVCQRSVFTLCRSIPISTCPRSVVTICPSVSTICPSVAGPTCPNTLPISCPEPSIGIACPVSQFIRCPTQPVDCQPSIAVRCPVSQFVRCPTQTVICQPTLDVGCQVSTAVICQVSNGPGCPQVSLADCPSFPCPNSLACFPDDRFGPGPGSQQADWDEYDPYGYDPYGTSY